MPNKLEVVRLHSDQGEGRRKKYHHEDAVGVQPNRLFRTRFSLGKDREEGGRTHGTLWNGIVIIFRLVPRHLFLFLFCVVNEIVGLDGNLVSVSGHGDRPFVVCLSWAVSDSD